MNPLADKYGAAQLASVNLVPQEIAERKKMRAVQLLAVVVVLIALGLVVIGYLGALGAKELARSDLQDAFNAQVDAFDARDERLPVFGAYVQREVSEYTMAQVGWGEIDMAQFVVAIANQASGKQSSFTTIMVVPPSALGASAEGQDPVFGNGVGVIRFSATASSAEEATKLIKRIEAVAGVASVRAVSEEASTNGEDPLWNVEGTALITPSALTMRLVPADSLTGLTGEAILRTLQGLPEPSASPSPEADEADDATTGEGN